MGLLAEEQTPAVLFVCTANICRSPMAAALFRSILKENGVDPTFWRIESAGTWATKGRPAAPEVVALLAARGMNLKAHRSRMLDQEMIKRFDLVITMETGHKEALQAEFRPSRERIYTLAELAGENGSVEDPMGGPPEAYTDAANEIERLLRLGLAEIISKTK
ncbi:protein-tyrosine-phosphatase [Longilinea arvoryzae]|uniref:Protein-tyrosine-phosphatase n=2 Tax=Longilinea arvoryzae TaxID=360412 RepID=A0A0S7BBY3_9CHLR|nr:protein-tyrosine-phosphatase [Longilinea arvoryzae]